MKVQFDNIFAIVAPGLEDVCADEIRSLLGCKPSTEKGGVTFSGSLEDLYRVNLWSRTASRILVRVGEVKARDFPELFRRVKNLPWGRFVRNDRAVVVRSSSRRSRLNHTGRISNTITEAINGALGRSGLPIDENAQLIIVRVENDVCRISIDSSGDLLYRRGYRTEVSRAPLRETLAAGILKLLDWDGRLPLYDPMCGSGSFVLEAALLASNRAPGQDRDFSFQQWPRYREGLWRNLVDEARRGLFDCPVFLGGSDTNHEVIESAKHNAVRAACQDVIKFETKEISQATAPEQSGLVICNPPYGVRLGDESKLVGLYKKIGLLYSAEFKGWQKALFCPSAELVAATGIDFRVRKRLLNGGLPTNLFVCDP